LLLDALKKAELAKQQQAAQQGGQGEETTLPYSSTRSGDQLRDAPSIEPLMTRDRLPDIDTPLELVPDQPMSGDTTGGAGLDLALTETPAPRRPGPASQPPLSTPGRASTAPHARPEPSMRLDGPVSEGPTSVSRPWAEDLSDDRTTARQVFAAKGADYNPRRPFYITLSLLACIAVGAVGYFWWELQPRSSFASARQAPQPASAQPAPVPAPTQTAQTSVPAPAGTAATNQAASAAPITGSQASPPSNATPPPATGTPMATTSVPAPATAPAGAGLVAPKVVEPRVPGTTASARTQVAAVPATQPTATPPQPRLFERPAAPAPAADRINTTARAEPPSRIVAPAPPAAAKPAPPPVSFQRAAPRIDPLVEDAYASFQRGDVDRARTLYLRAVQNDATNRDAQLGLAAVDLHNQHFASAEARYQRLLEMDPRDPHALAGIASIRGVADPVQSESRLKTLLTQQPDASMLHFALGNQYASQARWSEAQQSYFRAFSGDPENPDFAFNLAVSLDQIRQGRLALEYYERALRLADGRPAAFDRGTVANRVKELQQ